MTDQQRIDPHAALSLALERILGNAHTAKAYLEEIRPRVRPDPPPPVEPVEPREPEEIDDEPDSPDLGDGAKPPFDANTVQGNLGVFEDRTILGGERSAIFAGRNHEPFRLRIANVLGQSWQKGHTPQTFGGLGTWWWSRLHNVTEAEVISTTIQDIWAGRWKGEGHALYWNIIGGPGRVFLFDNLTIRNCGGHAIQLVSSSGKRAEEGAPAIPGGLIHIRDSLFHNTDQWPGRGSFMIQNAHTGQNVLVENTQFLMDGADYWKNISRSTGPSGGPFKSRGVLSCKGQVDFIRLEGCTIDCEQPGDREVAALSGADELTIENCHIPKGKLFVNSRYAMKMGWPMTKRVVFTGCTGDADVFTMEPNGIEWRKVSLGKVSSKPRATLGG